MSYTPKDGHGSLFKNDKGDNPARPDYRGDAMINGVHMEIAAWLKEGKKGKYMSLSFKPKGEGQEHNPDPAAGPPAPEMPF